MANWTRGIDFKNSSNTTRLGGIGVYGTDNNTDSIYLGFGSEPWTNSELLITTTGLSYKGNKIYHAGDRPTASEIGAATASHTHTPAQVGLPNVKDRSFNWEWGNTTPTHIWGSKGDSIQQYVFNGEQIRAFAGAAPLNHNHTSLTSVTSIGGAGSSGSWGSIDVGGAKNAWAGIHFSDYGYIWMVRNDGYTGMWKNGGSPVFAFDQNGALATGSVGWDKITGKPSTFAPTAHNHSILTGINDTRNAAYDPTTSPTDFKVTFQSNGTNGVSDGGLFYSLMHIPRWTDSSGGYGSQLIFTDNENIWYRRGTGNTTWGSWRRLWHSGNFDPDSKANASHSHAGVMMAKPTQQSGNGNTPDNMGVGHTFNYGVSSGVTGPILSFGNIWGNDGYYCQLNGAYIGGNDFKIRTLNGDNGTWNAWRTLWHNGNFDPNSKADIGGSPSFNVVYTTNNGNGTNIKIGDDCWIGDTNEADTMKVMGAQNTAKGMIRFGNGAKIGYNGGTSLDIFGETWLDGSLTATGNLVANNSARVSNTLYFTGAENGYWVQASWYGSQACIQTPNSRTGRIFSNNWLYCEGNTGVYFSSYDGGWFMQDSTWIRAYGSKSIYTPGTLQADSKVQSGFIHCTNSQLRVGGNVNSAYLEIYDTVGRTGYYGKGSNSSNTLYVSNERSNAGIYMAINNSNGWGGIWFTGDTDFRPNTNNAWNLGNSSYRFSTVYYYYLNAASDEKQKKDIRYMDVAPCSIEEENEVITYDDCYNFIKDELRMASYKYKQSKGVENNDHESIGFIAQDIVDTKLGKKFIFEHEVEVTEEVPIEENDEESITPDLQSVKTGETEYSYDVGYYSNITTAALKVAISKIEELTAEVNALKQIVYGEE